MPNPTMPGQLPPATMPNFSSNAPGGGAMTAGYNSAMKNLQASLQANQGTTNSQMMQLNQQLQQNQGQVQQSLANRGLGNTTVANTMQQAPLQTYNMGAAQVQNQGALRSMQGYDALAQASMQGGSQISQYAAPYAQSGYIQQQQQAAQQGANAPGGGGVMGAYTPQNRGANYDPMMAQYLMMQQRMAGAH